MAHGGMLAAVNRLSSRVSPVVRNALSSRPGYHVPIAGHSLGAGVTTLLASIWGPNFEGSEVQCCAYGPPCTLTIDATRAAYSHVNLVVCGVDVVSRFGLPTTINLCEALVAPHRRSGRE